MKNYKILISNNNPSNNTFNKEILVFYYSVIESICINSLRIYVSS